METEQVYTWQSSGFHAPLSTLINFWFLYRLPLECTVFSAPALTTFPGCTCVLHSYSYTKNRALELG